YPPVASVGHDLVFGKGDAAQSLVTLSPAGGQANNAVLKDIRSNEGPFHIRFHINSVEIALSIIVADHRIFSPRVDKDALCAGVSVGGKVFIGIRTGIVEQVAATDAVVGGRRSEDTDVAIARPAIGIAVFNDTVLAGIEPYMGTRGQVIFLLYVTA